MDQKYVVNVTAELFHYTTAAKNPDTEPAGKRFMLNLPLAGLGF